MLTLSGRLVLPDNDVAPSLADIAVGLGRTPRFGGQTKVWWSVLHHSFVCERLAAEFAPCRTPRERLELRQYALLHDAHEAGTGDVVTPWKTGEIREAQEALDTRIFREVVRHDPRGERTRVWMGEIDRRALVAESWVVGPPGLNRVLNETPLPGDIHAVQRVMQSFPEWGDTLAPEGRAETVFCQHVRALDVLLETVGI